MIGWIVLCSAVVFIVVLVNSERNYSKKDKTVPVWLSSIGLLFAAIVVIGCLILAVKDTGVLDINITVQ